MTAQPLSLVKYWLCVSGGEVWGGWLFEHPLTVLPGIGTQSFLLPISDSLPPILKKKTQNKENPVNTFLSSGFPKEKGEM